MKCLPEDAVIVINLFGSKVSYKGGKLLHSFNDQPAYRNRNGKVWYCKDGKYHRDYNKPALIYSNGKKYYYREGEEYHPENEKLT